MTRYRVAVLEEFKGSFKVVEVEKDEPPRGWCRLRVKATGICGRDRVVWIGGFRNLKPPLVLGHEVFGEYRGRPYAVYPLVRVWVGDKRVDTILGEHIHGGYAEYVDVPCSNLIPLPSREFEVYAASVCGVATMIHLVKLVGIKRGDRVLLTGATGGVGIHGAQYLVKLGVEVYGYTRRRELLDTLRDIGVVPVDSFDFYKKEGRVDYVVEIVGAPTINESMRALRPGGELVLVGNVSGEPIIVERPALLVMRELTIRGTAAYSFEEYREAIEFVSHSSLRAFYKVYSLEEVNKAYGDISSGRIIGRAVLAP